MQNRIKISRDALYKIVWEEPRTLLHSEFGVTDKAIEKACRRQNIPTPPRGYWTKQEHGGSPPREPLGIKPFGRSLWITFNQLPGNEGDEIYPFDPNIPPIFGERIQAVLRRAEVIALHAYKDLPLDKGFHPVVQKIVETDADRAQSELFLLHVPRRALHTSDVARRRLVLISTLCHVLSAVEVARLTLPHHACHLTLRIGEVDLTLYIDLPMQLPDGGDMSALEFRLPSQELLGDLALPSTVRGYEDNVPKVVSQLLTLAEATCRLRDLHRYETRFRNEGEQKLLRREAWVKNLREAIRRTDEAKVVRQLARQVSETKACREGPDRLQILEWIKAANAYADSIDPLLNLSSLTNLT